MHVSYTYPRLTKSAKSLGVRLALNACALHIPRLTKSAKSLGVRLALNACELHIPQADQERQESGCEVCSQCMCVTHTPG